MDWTGTIEVIVYRFLLSYPHMSNNFRQTIFSVISMLRNITLYVKLLALSILFTSLTSFLNNKSLASLR